MSPDAKRDNRRLYGAQTIAETERAQLIDENTRLRAELAAAQKRQHMSDLNYDALEKQLTKAQAALADCKQGSHMEYLEHCRTQDRCAKAEATLREATWLVAMLARFGETPAVGDWVVEKSHLVGVKDCRAHKHAIGQVVEVRDYSSYVIRCLDGTEQTWENAMMCKIPAIDAARKEG